MRASDLRPQTQFLCTYDGKKLTRPDLQSFWLCWFTIRVLFPTLNLKPGRQKNFPSPKHLQCRSYPSHSACHSAYPIQQGTRVTPTPLRVGSWNNFPPTGIDRVIDAFVHPFTGNLGGEWRRTECRRHAGSNTRRSKQCASFR